MTLPPFEGKVAPEVLFLEELPEIARIKYEALVVEALRPMAGCT